MKYAIYNNNEANFESPLFDELEEAKAYAEEECKEDSDFTDFIIYQISPVTQGKTQSRLTWTCLIGKALK